MIQIGRSHYLVLVAFGFSCSGCNSGPLTDPGTTLDLTGVYIPPDCDGQTIEAYPTTSDISEPSLQPNPIVSQANQLELFDAAVDAVADAYVDPGFNGIDWLGTAATYRAEIAAGIETETYYARMHDLIAALGDEHSYFLSPAQVLSESAALAGQNDFEGFGLLVLPLLEKDKATILAVFTDAPADHAGLEPHDSVISVNGFPLVEDGKPHPTRLRGPECTAAVLTVQSPGQAERNVTLVRHRITGPLPVYERLVNTTDGSRVGYIFVPTFLDSTIPTQIRNALLTLGPLDALIVDNRMNGGGLGSVMNAVLGFFTDGTVGHFESRTATRPLDITADPVHNSQTVPLVVLIGTGTVSYGEVFAGILQDVGRAQLVGKTTNGNVETLHRIDGSDGSQMWIANERFDPLNSLADWEETGIVPDVEAFADWDTFTFENDVAVNAAVQLLGH